MIRVTSPHVQAGVPPQVQVGPTRDEVMRRLGGCLLLACLVAGMIVLQLMREPTSQRPRERAEWQVSSANRD